MALHSSLTGVELHEPKGVASATEGQVYISDGAGSGTWTTIFTGWGNYKDGGVAQAFNTTPSLLSIDGAGASTEEDYLPLSIRGSGSLWNTSTDRITPIAVGDAYSLRLDLPVTGETSNPTELIMELDIASGAVYGSRTTIVTRYINTGKSTPYTVSVGFPVFVGSTFATNGGQIWLYTDTGSVTVTNPNIALIRTHGEVI
jgi:hypothetical protein